MKPRYWRTFPLESEGGGSRVHLAGQNLADDLTLCGFDLAGDDLVHRKDPEEIPGSTAPRITCPDCKAIIATVRAHLRVPDVVRKPPKATPCCDDQCRAFTPWDGPPDDVPSDYNPCKFGHKMSLYIHPTDPHVGGYYRRGCKDRQPITPTEGEEE